MNGDSRAFVVSDSGEIRAFKSSDQYAISVINSEEPKLLDYYKPFDNSMYEYEVSEFMNNKIRYPKDISIFVEGQQKSNIHSLEFDISNLKLTSYNHISLVLPLTVSREDGFIESIAKFYPKGENIQHINNTTEKATTVIISNENSTYSIVNVRSKGVCKILKPVRLDVVTVKEKFRMLHTGLIVEDLSNNSKQGESRLNRVPLLIEDYRPPTVGMGGGGGGLKSIYLCMQKFAFAEISLTMIDNGIKSVTGLPEGVAFESYAIKGSPTRAGKFPITMELLSGAKLPGLLMVTNVERKL